MAPRSGQILNYGNERNERNERNEDNEGNEGNKGLRLTGRGEGLV